MILVADELKLKQDTLAYTAYNQLREAYPQDDCILYHYYPLYRGEIAEDVIAARLLFVSPEHGIMFLMFIDEDRYLNQSELEFYNTLDAHILDRFIKRPELMKGRRILKFEIRGIVVGLKSEEKDLVIYTTWPKLVSTINEGESELTKDECRLVVSCIEGTSKLKFKKERPITKKTEEGKKTKGEILNIIQSHEAAFDIDQKQVALTTIDGPQRIRGLAGSGKTIILAMKAALYHLAHPDEEILYTYYTKNLKGLIVSLIEKFYRDNSDNQEPDWKKIHVLHAWGGIGLPGLYSRTCTTCGELPMDFASAKNLSKGANPFGYACGRLLATGKVQPRYDLTLIDEGQDFTKEFYRLCYALSKEKRIVWAYDEFQDIFNVKMQNEEELFGYGKDGKPLVSFKEKRQANEDIFLRTCYRNPRNILIAAFSLGLGIYNSRVLQRLQSNQHWVSLGFTVESGDCTIEGDDMVISRSEQNTPSILNEQLGRYSLQYKSCDSIEEECRFVAKCIDCDIRCENLRPDDICVICLDVRNMSNYYDKLEYLLHDLGIQCFNMLNAPNANTRFFYDNHVTLSTINKAKGNEAGMVYLMGVDSIFDNSDNVQLRNRLFTSMTRAKGWVSVSGCGSIDKFINEVNSLKDNGMKLIFKQPSEASTRTVMEGSLVQETEISAIVKAMANLERAGLSREDIIRIIGGKK